MLKTLVEGLSFSEAPRWHEGHLYYSDFYRFKVERVNLQGVVEVVAEVPTQPSGLGWLPDGRLLIVSMLDRKLLRQEKDGELVEHADLSGIATFHCNDMVVDQQGRAYVGNFGSDIEQPGAKPSPASLAFVHPDGTVESAAENILFPNGAVISADGKLLIVAETFGLRLTAFDVAADGTLSNRRVWADTAPHYPDGICQDDEGGVWIADPVNNCVVRFVEGGDITDKIDTGCPSYACMLGGDDRQQLFICTAKASGTAAAESRSGKIEYIDVAYRGVGQP